MKYILTSLILLLSTLVTQACHYSNLTLISGPTAIGGGNYQITIRVCIGQAENTGSTPNFSLCFNGANPINGTVVPSTLTNTYTAGMSGPFGCPAQTVTATANSNVSGSCVNYTTTSSVPAGFPLVGDRQDVGAGSAGNPNSFCFNLTVNLNNFPTSVTLGGVETNHAIYCSGNDGDTRPCNGSPETDETLTFSPPLPGLTFDYWGEATKFGNIVNWNTNGLNPKSFQVLRVEHGEDKILTTINVEGDGFHSFMDNDYHHDFNSYYIKAFSETGNVIYTTNSIFISNSEAQKVIRTVDILGNTINDPNYRGIKILIYDNGETRKIVNF